MSDHGRTITEPRAPDQAPAPTPRRWRADTILTVIAAIAFVAGSTASVVWALSLHSGRQHGAHVAAAPHARAAAPHAQADAPRVRYEAYRRPDPTLPAVPAGHVKRFRVDVLMHRTKVADDKPPLRVWSFGVNGRFMRGTGVSPPMVVEQGDRVEVTFVNGASAAMDVDMPHSLDMHAAELAPNVAFKTIGPGATTHYSFIARNPGVFMYHCATEPMVFHLGSGMVGMFVVKPRRHLPKSSRCCRGFLCTSGSG